VTLPNRNFDPQKGHRLYNRYLDELEYGEELGFDVLAVNEHHQTAYGLMPSPIVTASALARRTSKVKIAILGSALPLRSHPMMVAEEHAMIDVISGGRLISGFVRGIGAEYHTFGVNPTFSHDRFHEAHDLKMYRDTCQGHGYQAKDSQLGWAVPVYVSDTDSNAIREARTHFEAFRNVFVKMPLEMLLPPGYTSRESMKNVIKAKAQMF